MKLSQRTSPTRSRRSGSSARPVVDALAVAIGTSHGAYKFTRKPTHDIWRWTSSRRSTVGYRTVTW